MSLQPTVHVLRLEHLQGSGSDGGLSFPFRRASAEFGLQARLLQVLHHGLGVQPKCLSATLIAWKLLHTQDLAGLHKDLGTTLLR